MKSLTLKTLDSDNFVVILALLLATIFFTAGAGKTQQLQRGINVQLASTTGASSRPDADSADAWIVTVTEANQIYFGVDPMTPQALADAMETRPRTRGQELFVKADARAPYATVAKVLEAARANRLNQAILLTRQPSGAQPGTIIAPKGLPIWLDSAAAAAAVVVQIGPGQGGSPTLTVNNQQVPLKTLHLKLAGLLQSSNDRVVVLKPGQVPFADVAHVVDVCNMAGAKPVLAAPEL